MLFGGFSRESGQPILHEGYWMNRRRDRRCQKVYAFTRKLILRESNKYSKKKVDHMNNSLVCLAYPTPSRRNAFGALEGRSVRFSLAHRMSHFRVETRRRLNYFILGRGMVKATTKSNSKKLLRDTSRERKYAVDRHDKKTNIKG